MAKTRGGFSTTFCGCESGVKVDQKTWYRGNKCRCIVNGKDTATGELIIIKSKQNIKPKRGGW